MAIVTPILIFFVDIVKIDDNNRDRPMSELTNVIRRSLLAELVIEVIP